MRVEGLKQDLGRWWRRKPLLQHDVFCGDALSVEGLVTAIVRAEALEPAREIPANNPLRAGIGEDFRHEK